jgi:hypothetical protein
VIKIISTYKSKIFFPVLIALFIFCFSAKNGFAQGSPSVLYVPLIGITSVPEPLALPNGVGNVTYNYAVKNFTREIALTDVQVVDDSCAPVKFVEGDDNHDSKLDFTETWRYTCTAKLSATTASTATATGSANNVTATHQAHATVVVGSVNPAPLVSIVNVTKVTNPAPAGNINFTYRVTNPGLVPLSDVSVTDDKCSNMSGKLGDTNGNGLLDIDESWIYTCTTALTQTTTDTVKVTASGNGLNAADESTITINIDNSIPGGTPLFDVAISPAVGVASSSFKIIVWGILSVVLLALIIFFFFTRKKHE